MAANAEGTENEMFLFKIQPYPQWHTNAATIDVALLTPLDTLALRNYGNIIPIWEAVPNSQQRHWSNAKM